MSELSAGEAMVQRIVADMAEAGGVEPDQRDRELLAVVASIADEIAELEQVVHAEGRTAVLKDGRPVIHGAVTEVRLQRAALAKLLAALDVTGTGKNPVKQRAAMIRWAEHNSHKAAMNGGG